jgi:enamine deaminase RidA (YjgF/YER057c/UK114 family)
MATPKHFNPKAGSPPYKSLFSNVTIAPAGSSLAFISTQWAADPVTGELMEGVENNYGKQSKIIWGNIVEILKELGVTMKEIVHVTVNFKLVPLSALPTGNIHEMVNIRLIH